MSNNVKLYRYVLRNEPGQGQGWAIVVLGSDGFFSSISDYGNYCNGWGHHGCADFREFVRDLGRKGEGSYFMGKVGRKDNLNLEATVARLREWLLEYRRDGRITAERYQHDARLLRALEGRDIDLAVYFNDREVYFDDYCGTYDYPCQLRMFADKVLPRLADLIDAELAAEAAVAAA